MAGDTGTIERADANDGERAFRDLVPDLLFRNAAFLGDLGNGHKNPVARPKCLSSYFLPFHHVVQTRHAAQKT